MLSLHGEVAHRHEKPILLLQAVLGLRDGTTRGGHLLAASVWPALEVVVTEHPRYLRRRFDAELQLPLIELNGGA